MGPFVVVVVSPSFCLHPYLIDGSEDVSVQNRSAIAAVEALDITALCRTSRLNVAAKLLKNDKDNVTEVSDMVGFKSVSYFIRALKA